MDPLRGSFGSSPYFSESAEPCSDVYKSNKAGPDRISEGKLPRRLRAALSQEGEGIGQSRARKATADSCNQSRKIPPAGSHCLSPDLDDSYGGTKVKRCITLPKGCDC